MKTTLLAGALLATALGGAALAWTGGPHGPDRPWGEGPQVTAAATLEAPAPRADQAVPRDGPRRHDRGEHHEGGLTDLLGSVFFLGLFNH